MWTRRSHTLTSLTKINSIKINFKKTQVKKKAFVKIKGVVARDTLLTYPDFNETFKIHIDTSAL